MNYEILNKYIELIDKDYCDDCNELNCLGNFSQKDIAKNIKAILEENRKLKSTLELYKCSLHREHEAIHKANDLEGENQELKNQLEYLRSGEYLNQLKFERNMLQDVVDDLEVASEDKAFIDFTHRNTELLEENQRLKNQQKEFIEWLERESKEVIRDAGYHQRICLEILSKYKEIIGGDNK